MTPLLKHTLANAIAAVCDTSAAEIAPLLEKPKNKEFGDLALPCFILAKRWRVSPVAAAERLAAELELPGGIAEAHTTGPFLNFRLDRSKLAQTTLHARLQEASPLASRGTVVVEYSSPNIAKPFHVGHLRATLIGNCLDRVYRALGWKVESVNHLGDWGTQFGFVWAGCNLWGKPEEPTVARLVELYRQATGLRERQEQGELAAGEADFPDVNEMARAFFIDLEKGEPYAVEFWKECVAVSLEYLRTTYERLHVTFDHYIGESFYSDKLDSVRSDLESAGLLTESEGALGIDLGEPLGFARVFTPDGRSLYLTRDLATAKYRAERFQFERAIYVVGAPQTLHFQQLVEILRRLGRSYADSLTHVAFGHVLGMKTRGSGSFIELNEFLDEAFERSLEAYHTQVTKRPDGLDEKVVARGVALAAIIFSTLSRANIKDVHFSWDHALEFQGDSGPYLLYAYARINGIKQKALEAGIQPSAAFDPSRLTEDIAHETVSLIAEFQQTLERVAELNEPSILVQYALELAKTVSRAYLALKVVGAEDQATAVARITLFEAARRTLSDTITLLGITPLERM
ncbi:MAG: arginine--tRNA ligase [Bdellovibrionales bacterium]|nr:arginine--tRNA ligase [Bdellovibrionales bacterium]